MQAAFSLYICFRSVIIHSFDVSDMQFFISGLSNGSRGSTDNLRTVASNDSGRGNSLEGSTSKNDPVVGYSGKDSYHDCYATFYSLLSSAIQIIDAFIL